MTDRGTGGQTVHSHKKQYMFLSIACWEIVMIYLSSTKSFKYTFLLASFGYTTRMSNSLGPQQCAGLD